MSKNKTHFVLTGMGRTASHWLSNTLSQHDGVHVEHETFTGDDFKEKFGEWCQLKYKKVGMVNSYARYFIPEIEKEIHPQWGFLWREPLGLMRSGIVKRSLEGMYPYAYMQFPSQLRIASSWIFGELEVMLGKFETLGIDAKHWNYHEYTKTKGLLELAAWLEIPMSEIEVDFKASNTTEKPVIGKFAWLKGKALTLRYGKIEVPPVAEWSLDQKTFILDTIHALPRVSKVYESLGLLDNIK